MRQPIFYGSLILFFYTHFALAANLNITCDPPQGTRIDYFVTNTLNLQNETFLMGRDRVAGMQPKIVLNQNYKSVSFTIGDTIESTRQSQASNMHVVAFDENQISFTGLVNNAPILATYYPKLRILIYSQQSTWPGRELQGARAVIFYSKCASPVVS